MAILQGEELPSLEGKPSGDTQHVEVAITADESRSTKQDTKKSKKKPKGDARILVSCTEVEKLVFGDRYDPDKTAGRKRDRAKRGVANSGDWQSVDMADGDPGLADVNEIVDGDLLARMSIRSGTRIRPAQDVSEVNGGVGGEKGWAERTEENEEMLKKRLEGQRKAHERELVRCAARRGVAFGFLLKTEDSDGNRRKCEAVMQGKVVESSFAKGDWSIRWRED